MNLRYKSRISRSLLWLFMATLGAGMTACSDDDTPVPQAINSPSTQLSQATTTSLTFSWDKVNGAVQYGYELKDPSGDVLSGGTSVKQTVTFTGLQPGTTYTLDVYAYSNVADAYKKSSPVATLTASTLAIVPLQTPAAVVNMDGAVITVSWDPVPDAEYYNYSYLNMAPGSTPVTGTTTECSVRLTTLAVGNYEFSVTAESDAETRSSSQPAKVTFSRLRNALWSVEGQMALTAYAGYEWTSTLVAYDDGTYVIEGWYAYEGYNLEFTVNSNSTLHLLTGTPYTSGGYDMQSIPYASSGSMEFYNDYASSFAGSEKRGELYFTEASYGKFLFTWGDAAPTMTIDDLVGAYSMTSSGSDYIQASVVTDFSWTGDITITKIDDNTIEIPDPYWYYYPIKGTVDFFANTITFAPQEVGYYVFCKYGDCTASVVATFDENGTITMSGWSAYYQPYDYYYVWNTESVLTRQ